MLEWNLHYQLLPHRSSIGSVRLLLHASGFSHEAEAGSRHRYKLIIRCAYCYHCVANQLRNFSWYQYFMAYFGSLPSQSYGMGGFHFGNTFTHHNSNHLLRWRRLGSGLCNWLGNLPRLIGACCCFDHYRIHHHAQK